LQLKSAVKNVIMQKINSLFKRLAILEQPTLRALKQTRKISWMILKVYIPVSLLTFWLKDIGALDYIAPFFAPFMKYFGLPGEAAICLIAGFTNFIYAAIGTMAVLDLSPKQITILGIMIGFCHNLILETILLSKLKMVRLPIGFFRLFVALLAGILIKNFIPNDLTGEVLNSYIKVDTFTWVSAIKSVLSTGVQIIVVLLCINLIYEYFMIWRFREFIADKSKFITKIIGFSESAFAAWVVGFFIGVVYGAGILYTMVSNNKLSHKDISLVTIWISLAHAIIEDCMIFVVIGGSFWWIFSVRVLLAFIIVRLLAIGNVYKYFTWIGMPRFDIEKKL